MARVILQMGHCFRRTGATGTNGLDGDPNEQEFAQAACYAAASHLRVAGHSPIVIDADEPDNSYRGDAFVAVHCDGSVSSSARGASVGYRTAEGAHLGAEFKAAYARRGWVGWRPDNYTAALGGYYGTGAAVRVGNRYALIVEAGFLTSPHDEPLLSIPDGPERCARAITDAVVGVYGGTTAPTPPKGTSPTMIDSSVRPGSDEIHLVCIGTDRAVWHYWAPTPAGLKNAPGEALGGQAKGVACDWTAGPDPEFVVTVHSATDDIWQRRYNATTNTWTDWEESPLGARLLPPAKNL